MPQRLGQRSRAREPQLLSPLAAGTKAPAPRACAPQQETPLQREASTPQQKEAPAWPQLEKACLWQ